MKILVTGAAGFIGSALCKKLVAEGNAVIGIDNFNDYYDVSLKRDRVAALIPDVEIVEADFADQSVLSDLFSTHSFNVVCHFAASAGVRHSTESPQEFTENNVVKLLSLLEMMRAHECKRMVFASTSSVYGNSTKVPFIESAAADTAESVYGWTKRAGELLLKTYHSQYGIESTALRFFTVYGPWSRPDMAMLKFAQKIINGDTIDIYNNGDLRRDFTYIDDIVAGFVAAIEKPLGCETINLGRGAPVGLLEYVDLIESALGVEAKRNLLPMQPGDVYETFADTTKAKELLGFEAKVSVEVGVTRFSEWFADYYKTVS